jgi:hypothetical protein
MAARCKVINAKFKVDTAAGKGTRILIELPVNK